VNADKQKELLTNVLS